MGKKSKGHWKSGGAIQHMPKNVLSDLFQWSQPKHTAPAGWLCSVCSIHNYDVRKSCRQCGVARAGTQARGNQSKFPPPSKRVVTTTQPTVHPAAVAEGAKARIVELDIIIATMKNRADCTSVLKDLEADKRCQEELIEKAKPPKRSKFREVEETRAYVGRVEAKAQSLDEEIEALKVKRVTMEADLVETRAKLLVAERELAAEVTPNVNSLEDAVRMLLVTLHSCQLPPQASEAAQSIMSLLPTPPPSMDAKDKPLDVPAPTGMSDEALSWTKRELEDIEDSDAALLTWAKRLKVASHRTAPY